MGVLRSSWRALELPWDVETRAYLSLEVLGGGGSRVQAMKENPRPTSASRNAFGAYTLTACARVATQSPLCTENKAKLLAFAKRVLLGGPVPPIPPDC